MVNIITVKSLRLLLDNHDEEKTVVKRVTPNEYLVKFPNEQVESEEV